MNERPQRGVEMIELAGSVLPMNLQFEVQDFTERSGAPGDVLTSQGPGAAPVWSSVARLAGAGGGFGYQQHFASDHWEIHHGMTHRPSVSVTNDAGEEIEAAVSHPGTGLTVLDFNWPLTGTAWLI